MAVFVGSIPVQTERGRKREKGMEEASTQSVGRKIKTERSWKLHSNEEGRKICLIAPSLVAARENLSQWDKNVRFSCQLSRETARLPPTIQPLGGRGMLATLFTTVFNLRMSPSQGGRNVHKS